MFLNAKEREKRVNEEMTERIRKKIEEEIKSAYTEQVDISLFLQAYKVKELPKEIVDDLLKAEYYIIHDTIHDEMVGKTAVSCTLLHKDEYYPTYVEVETRVSRFFFIRQWKVIKAKVRFLKEGKFIDLEETIDKPMRIDEYREWFELLLKKSRK